MKIHLNNFRSFKKEVFDFSRINILIGENSSGKSSLLKFLLMLKQSAFNSNDSNLTLSGNLVDLGNYKEMIHYQDVRKKLSFAFSTDIEYKDYFLSFMSDFEEDQEESEENLAKKRSTLKSISAQFDKAFNNETTVFIELNKELNKHENIKTVIKNKALGTLEIHQIKKETLTKSNFVNVLTPRCHITYFRNNSQAIRIENLRFDKNACFTIVNGIDIEDAIQKEHNVSAFNEIAFLLVSQNYFIDYFSKIEFVSSVKNIPERYYFERDKKRFIRANDIQSIINVIGDNDVPKAVLDKFIQTVNKFGIAEDLKVIKGDKVAVKELRVKVSDLFSNIVDVGYGVGLQLPILFQACVSEIMYKGEIIIIEQPEVHLHPSLQAKFIEALLSIGDKNKYYIETHSEHIIRKLQILIKSKFRNIRPDDVSIYYLKKGDQKSIKSRHDISEDGRISSPFPDGFFDTSYTLAKELVFNKINID
ncbi:DUF3696 domain-containing protein [Hymenobacter sediminicola]|uniref:DUF3696 domain-containing protein n=1 Tax=Hymenobacter sediminicola TaxID=2761579 RepID=A0A7G7W8P9_9BACT|nr:DUF3696 domain-containing protein [Hymenobacter sediminicola]QNH62742.1 DUF3696 domain-containing protein [Hymenobacter sediminicola]